MHRYPFKGNMFICPHCSSRDKHGYCAWVKSLAELPLLYGHWKFSHFLWDMFRCSNCNRKFPSAFEMKESADIDSSLPYVIEWVAMECHSIEGDKFRAEDIEIIPIQPGYSKGYGRGGLPFDIVAWIGLAAASGVVGNIAYDAIKRAVVEVRKDIVDKRKSLTQEQSKNAVTKEESGYYGKLLQEWDTMSDEELERRIRLFYEYARKRLKNVKL